MEVASSPTKPASVSTRERIIEAALQTLRSEGFAGTSARAIARTGGFNQALIFYHFGTLGDLLLAALVQTSSRRMARYREAVSEARSPEELLQVATELYREDLEEGHITVLSEMVAGSVGREDLASEVLERMQPWVDFAEEQIAKVAGSAGLGVLLSPRTLAVGLVALYLGVDLLTHLEGNLAHADELFDAARTFVQVAAPLLQASHE